MPFINININIARQMLDDQTTLTQLLRDGQINPKEYEVLEYLRKYSQSDAKGKVEAKEKLQELCHTYFERDASRALDLLIKFADRRQNVSWVLFSRTNQFIPYVETNPLDGYIPRKNDIIKRSAIYKLVLKAEV